MGGVEIRRDRMFHFTMTDEAYRTFINVLRDCVVNLEHKKQKDLIEDMLEKLEGGI